MPENDTRLALEPRHQRALADETEEMTPTGDPLYQQALSSTFGRPAGNGFSKDSGLSYNWGAPATDVSSSGLLRPAAGRDRTDPIAQLLTQKPKADAPSTPAVTTDARAQAAPATATDTRLQAAPAVATDARVAATPAARLEASSAVSASVKYGEKTLDEALKTPNLARLKIDGVPDPTVRVSTWMDEKGFYIWYINGSDNKQPHYIPASLDTVEVNGVPLKVTEMRTRTAEAYALAHDRSKNSVRAVDGETIYQFGNRMSGLSNESLNTITANLRDAASKSEDPGLNLLLTHFTTAQVVRPILNSFNPATNTAMVIDKQVQDHLDYAVKQAEWTAYVARQQRNYYVQWQAERLQVMLSVASGIIKVVPPGTRFELP